jgi:hypothetical protein
VSNPSGASPLERSDSWTDTFSLSLALDSAHYYHKSTINIKYFYFYSLLQFYKKLYKLCTKSNKESWARLYHWLSIKILEKDESIEIREQNLRGSKG